MEGRRYDEALAGVLNFICDEFEGLQIADTLNRTEEAIKDSPKTMRQTILDSPDPSAVIAANCTTLAVEVGIHLSRKIHLQDTLDNIEHINLTRWNNCYASLLSPQPFVGGKPTFSELKNE